VILEAAVLSVKKGESEAFEAAFGRAEGIIASMPGHISHELLRSLEKPGQYILLVRWRSLEDHTEGFRKSGRYAEWRELLHHFYDPFPIVEHYSPVDSASSPQSTGPRTEV
jgi:heme-degrading monooxygenase HmoA